MIFIFIIFGKKNEDIGQGRMGIGISGDDPSSMFNLPPISSPRTEDECNRIPNKFLNSD